MSQHFVNDLEAMTSSDGYKCISLMCKLLGRIVHLICDTHTNTSRRSLAWATLAEVTGLAKKLVERVENDWANSVFAYIEGQEQLGKLGLN